MTILEIKKSFCLAAAVLVALACLAGENCFADEEAEATLEARLADVFAKSAAHYKALDAAATAQMHGKDGNLLSPRGWLKWKTGRNEIDMRSIWEWTSGHYPGALWYLYEATGDGFFRDRATVWTEILAPISKNTGNHDVGFMMYCSYGNARRLLGTDRYDAILRETAESLCQRYNAKLGLVRSWGDKDDRTTFRVIPDNLMNLELLEWAAQGQTNRFSHIAESHADVTMRHHFRADGGCYHVLDYDQVTCRVKGIERGQGASCKTAWSRGQSWAIYGYTMLYRMTGFFRFLDFARKLADWAMANPNMPADGIPYWDYGAPGEERDSSAGAIMASALLELSQFVDAPNRARYRAFAVKQLTTLTSDAYFSEGDEIGHFLLKHGVGNKPGGTEIDTPLNYGDYYFLEALLRFRALRRQTAAIRDVRAKLPARAALPGAGDRAGWQALAKTAAAAKLIAKAETYRDEPIPDTSDELYLEYSRTGNRSHYERVYFDRIERFVTLVVAEALERKRRFVPRIVEYADAICAMKSWVLPAHDGGAKVNWNFLGLACRVDLFSSQIASHLAYAVCDIGDELPPETVRKIRANCEKRVFAPFRRALALLRPDGTFAPGVKTLGHHWMYIENNWNAVCHDNVAEAALGLIDDPYDRALAVWQALRGIRFYADGGFAADGYCSEGMGYWNFGFGHLLMLGLVLRDLTDGQIDIFTEPKYRKAAEYAYGYRLEPTLSPAFSDGTGNPSPGNLALVRRVWPDLTGEAAEGVTPFGSRADGVCGGYIDHFAALLGFGKVAPATGAKDAAPTLRSVFPSGQVWLMRAGRDLSVAVKGGHNAEHHNHNDIGSYYLVSNGKPLAGDPGGEEYTSRTFGSHRYDSKVLSSYGHPVPVVGGQLQKGEGREYCAKVVKTDFTDARDTVVLDLTAAYGVKSLKSLVRTFVFDREAKTFSVTDRVAFSEPTAFETAYTTFKGEKFGKVDAQVKVTRGGAVEESVETVENPRRLSPDRHAIRFSSPVMEAEVTVVICARK